MSKHGAALLAAAGGLVIVGASIFSLGGRAVAQEPAQLRTDALAGTAFTYQGRLTDGGVAADGVYDFRLQLYDQATGGTASGEVVIDDLIVSDGLFAAALDFGAGAFSGDARWLALAVRPGADTGAYTDLSPRQPLTPAPYALALPGMRTIQGGDSPSVVGGYGGNIVDNGVVGATIAGGGKAGDENRVTADHGSVGGGRANVVSGGANGSNATIGGGGRNSTNGENATVAGGWDNAAWEYAATIGGGANNRANGSESTIAGGSSNQADGDLSAIGGGRFITVTARYGAVAGGFGNRVTSQGGFIGGGDHNTAEGDGSVVGGGTYNLASGVGSTVAGGTGNTPSGPDSTVGGGAGNTAGGRSAVVAGGGGTYFDGDMAIWSPNEAGGDFASVGGGGGNTAGGHLSTVAGGMTNTAGGRGATISGGAGNEAGGDFAAVAGGLGNFAIGNFSYAAGQSARAIHEGSFVWSDSSLPSLPFESTAPNEFSVRATGGVIMASGYIPQSAIWTGVILPPGAGSWQSLSDRRAKTDVVSIDGRDVLAQLAAVPISTWSYRAEEEGVRHIGPMADDFSAAFDVGSDATHISTVDADGVALAAIQGLYEVVQDKDRQVRELETRLAETEARLTDLEARLAEVETWSLDAATTGPAEAAPAQGRTGSPATSRVPLALAALVVGAMAYGRRDLGVR